MSHRYAIVMLYEIAEVLQAGYYKWKAMEKARKSLAEQDADLKESIYWRSTVFTPTLGINVCVQL